MKDFCGSGNGGGDDLEYPGRPAGTTGLSAIGDETVRLEHSEPLLLQPTESFLGSGFS